MRRQTPGDELRNERSSEPATPIQNFLRCELDASSGGAVHFCDLHVVLLHSLSSSQDSPSPLREESSAALAVPPFLHPGKSGGQSPFSAHCDGGDWPGRCGGSLTASFLTLTL